MKKKQTEQEKFLRKLGFVKQTDTGRWQHQEVGELVLYEDTGAHPRKIIQHVWERAVVHGKYELRNDIKNLLNV